MNKPSLELTPAEWRRAIDIDLSGVFYCAQAAGRRMAGQGGGVILSTASLWGLSTSANRLAYCAAKAGRSEERRVGKGGVRTCKSRCAPYHLKKKKQKNQKQ